MDSVPDPIDAIMHKRKLGLPLTAVEQLLAERVDAYILNAPGCHHAHSRSPLRPDAAG